MSQEKKPSVSEKVGTGLSTAQTVFLNKEFNSVVLIAGLMYLTNDGWEGFMNWMRQDEQFTPLEEMTLMGVFAGVLKKMGGFDFGTSGKAGQKSATS